MIRAFAEILRAAACAHVEAMHAIAAHQRFLREARDISRFGRAFETVQKNNLASRALLRLMLECDYSGNRIDRILLPDRGKSAFVYLTRPEITRDRKQMRVTEYRLELGVQTRL